MPDWQNYLIESERADLVSLDQRLADDRRARNALMNRAKQRKHRETRRV